MRKKYLFLDVDGVLNSDEYFHSELFNKLIEDSKDIEPSTRILLVNINPESINLLNKVIKETNCKVILITKWRKHPQLRHILKGLGLKGKIRGEIGDCRYKTTGIQTWLNTGCEFEDNYAILSEEECNDTSMFKHYVRTDWRVGLTEEKVNELISILNSEYLQVRDIWSGEITD